MEKDEQKKNAACSRAEKEELDLEWARLAYKHAGRDQRTDRRKTRRISAAKVRREAGDIPPYERRSRPD